MANITVSEGWTAVESLEGAISITGTEKLRYANMLNRDIHQALYASNPEQLRSLDTFSTQSGTLSYTAPSDFDAQSLHGNAEALGLFVYDSNGVMTKKIPYSAPDSGLSGWYWDGTNIVFTKDQGDLTYCRLYYIPTLTQLTDLSDEMLVDWQYTELVQYGLQMHYLRKEQDIARAQVAESMYLERLKDLHGSKSAFKITVRDV